MKRLLGTLLTVLLVLAGCLETASEPVVEPTRAQRLDDIAKRYEEQRRLDLEIAEKKYKVKEPKAEPAEPNEPHYPKIVSVIRGPSGWPDSRTQWIVTYRYGPVPFEMTSVTIPADYLTDELVRQYVTEDYDRIMKERAEELDAQKRFIGKEY